MSLICPSCGGRRRGPDLTCEWCEGDSVPIVDLVHADPLSSYEHDDTPRVTEPSASWQWPGEGTAKCA